MKRPSVTHKSAHNSPKRHSSKARYSREQIETIRSKGDAKLTVKRTVKRNQKAAPVHKPKQRPEASTVSVRLNKYLADAGIASRRHADELIASGVVRINNRLVVELGTRVNPGDMVTVKGEPVSPYKHLTYLVLNKPKDHITTTSDERGRKTIMDLIPLRERLYPVGRLDRNTTGVILITNDGELATRLMHPRYQVEREYIVGLDKDLRREHAREIVAGVELDDGLTGPTEIVINPMNKSELSIVLREGKNREVRRLFEHFSYEVKRLHRTRYAGIGVEGLSRGAYRHLSRDEIRLVRRMVGLSGSV